MSVDEPTLRKIGRYEIIRKIATGGMAELFLARFVGPGGFEKRCALKRILPQFAADQTFTKMFLNEARVTAMFDHPNLVQIFELGQDEEGQFYIAMELVNGMNLRQLSQMAREREQLIPVELSAYMMAQALDGLAYAHEFKNAEGHSLQLVHRDISLQNILVSYEGAVKVVDFGIVKGTSITGETQVGMLKGKVAYMSPEQASGDPIDGRSDLFSIGICLYELVTGQKPFSGTNEIMMLKAILDDAPRPMTSLVSDYPPRLAEITHRALEKERERRYQSARGFQLELQGLLMECPTPLGRHILAEYIRSLTEAGTETFDRTKLRIPRTADSRDPSSGPRYANSVSAVETLPTPTASSDLREAPLTMNDGITGEVRAAGISRLNPAIGAVFAASLFAIATALWLARSTEEGPPIVIEPSTVASTTAPNPDRAPMLTAPSATQEVLHAPTRSTSIPVDGGPAPRASSPAQPQTVPSSAEAKAAAASERRQPSESLGTLTITSVPRGLLVKDGDKAIGTTPLVGISMPSGTHHLRLSNAKLGISKTLRVDVAKGDLTTHNVAIARGTLSVVTRPWSEVYVNGVSFGKTPVRSEIYEGKHQVRLVNPEEGERTQKIEIAAGEVKNVRVKF